MQSCALRRRLPASPACRRRAICDGDAPSSTTGPGPDAAAAAAATARAQPAQRNTTLALIDGIRVGHHTLTVRPTGCTVILADGGAVAGIAQRGAAPGTRETDRLRAV